MARNLHQKIPALALLALGGLAMVASFWIPPDYDGSTGARVFPLMSAVTLLLLGGLMLLPVRNTIQTEEDKAELPTGPLLLLALVVTYLGLIGKIGYLLSTGLVTPAALWLFGIRHPAGLLVAALVTPAIFHLIFFEALGVFPPYGQWFDLLDLIGG